MTPSDTTGESKPDPKESKTLESTPMDESGSGIKPHPASGSGVTFYVEPSRLDLSQVDPMIRPVVAKINRSGWVWTGESCQGHPDATGMADTGWLHNTDPYLRLICAKDHLGPMLARLVNATLPCHEDDEYTTPTLRIYRSDARRAWAEVLVYVQARNAMERNHGIRVLARFAEALDA